MTSAVEETVNALPDIELEKKESIKIEKKVETESIALKVFDKIFGYNPDPVNNEITEEIVEKLVIKEHHFKDGFDNFNHVTHDYLFRLYN